MRCTWDLLTPTPPAMVRTDLPAAFSSLTSATSFSLASFPQPHTAR